MRDDDGGLGAVAFHRWFAQGEDWAYHPWFEERSAALLRALDLSLKLREMGVLELPALGGYLVGEMLPDHDCPDARAQTRAPTILRIAFVPRRPTEDQRIPLLHALRQVPVPREPGPDGTLVLPTEVCSPLALPPSPVVSPPQRGRHLLVLTLLVGIILLLAAAGLAWWFILGSPLK